MNSTLMNSMGAVVEASTRANLERNFGLRLPPSVMDRTLDDAGFFDGGRWQKVERPDLLDRAMVALKSVLAIGAIREARVDTRQVLRRLPVTELEGTVPSAGATTSPSSKTALRQADAYT